MALRLGLSTVTVLLRMQRRCLRLWTALIVALGAVLAATPARAQETVRIAIIEHARRITLEGEGLEVKQIDVGERYTPVPGGRAQVEVAGEVKGELLLDGAPVHSADGVKFRSTGFVHAAGKPVRGQIEIRPDGDGITAINVVPVEDYLAAVLGSEMPRSFPMEALKAQAVAARTYAVQRKIAAWGRPYHLSATVLSQVYGGARAEDARTREAVQATAGEVLVFQMEPIEAYFHASCGGRTESGLDALARDLPYLQPVDCPCGSQPRAAWTQRLGSTEFARVMPELPQLRVVARTATGRVKTVELVAGRTRRTISGVDLRRLVGYDRIRSLDFTAERQGASLLLRGKGHGHGAGLCQWGAKVLAERGQDYRAILTHYYPGAELRRMY